MKINSIIKSWRNTGGKSKNQLRSDHNMLENNIENYRRIIETTEEGIWVGDPHGKTLFVNQKMASMLGYSPEEMIGKAGLDIIELGHKDRSRAPRTLEEGTSVQHEYKFRRKDGGTIWTQVNASPLFDDHGKYFANLWMHTDITEQKKLLDEREQFTRKLIQVQEEERKRIARDLHDDTAQYLALLALELDALIQKDKKLSPETISKLQNLKGTAEKVLREVRRFSHELRPNMLEQFGIIMALELLTNEHNSLNETRVTFIASGSEKRLQDETELSLFRIVQEALSNIRKHSRAAAASINLTYGRKKVRLSISDDGKGFDMNQKISSGTGSGIGLMGMKERAKIIGATLKVKSEPGNGTTITVTVPLPELKSQR